MKCFEELRTDIHKGTCFLGLNFVRPDQGVETPLDYFRGTNILLIIPWDFNLLLCFEGLRPKKTCSFGLKMVRLDQGVETPLDYLWCSNIILLVPRGHDSLLCFEVNAWIFTREHVPMEHRRVKDFQPHGPKANGDPSTSVFELRCPNKSRFLSLNGKSFYFVNLTYV